jgi:hypothetical protein
MKTLVSLLLFSFIFLFNLNSKAQDTLSYIIIRDAPDGGGNEVQNWIRSDDGYIRLYCAGYEINGNFIGNMAVSWIVSLDYGNLIKAPAENSDSLVLEPWVSDGRIDYIRAYHRELNIVDSTGVLYLVDKSLSYIQIRTAPDGGGSEVSDFNMTTEEETMFYATGYDSSNNFICNQIVNWTLTGSLDGYVVTDTAFTFSPNLAPTSGSIIATVDNLMDATGTITVIPGALCYIEVLDFPEYKDTVTVSVGDSMMLIIVGFDCNDNPIPDIVLDSTDVEFMGTFAVEFFVSSFFHSILFRFIGSGQGKIILMGTDTSGVIIVQEPQSITVNKTLPKKFKLEQAYPNPFNPSTTIRFYLPKSEHVKLEIYNNIGQKVETLIDRHMTAGEHKVEFNAMYLSSGVYYYRLVTANFTDVKKIILMK